MMTTLALPRALLNLWLVVSLDKSRTRRHKKAHA
jgi:hypothetical protein